MATDIDEILEISQPVCAAGASADTIRSRDPATARRLTLGGIGRLAYFLGTVLCSVGIGVFSLDDVALSVIGSLAGLIALLALMFQRLKNIGWNGWLALLGIIPFINLAVAIPCAIFPPGYAATKRLDSAGRILLCILIGLIIIIPLLALIVAAQVFCL